jgi:hypothetical protein
MTPIAVSVSVLAVEHHRVVRMCATNQVVKRSFGRAKMVKVTSCKSLRNGEPTMKAELKVNACIICGRTVQPTENWVRCHVWGGFASFHWHCFGEYLRTDSEHQVENVVWKATTKATEE